MKLDQIIAIVFIAILVINIVLFALKMISQTIFWVVIAISFGVSYTIKKLNGRKRK